MELKAYIKRYLPTLYLQHRWKMNEPVDEDELVARVRDGITEDTGIELAPAEVERLLEAHVPGAWRSLTPAEAEAMWDKIVLERKGGESWKEGS